MIFNFTEVTSLVDKLNCAILGWFYSTQNATRRDVASDRQYQENQAGGMFGLLVSGGASNRH